MSNLSAALAAALQNDSGISVLISGVIPGRNFSLQDSLLDTSPYACIAVVDLPKHESPYIGTTTSAETISMGQIEVRCISKASETNVKALAELVKTYLWTHATVPFNGADLSLGAVEIFQVPDTGDETTSWHEILTVTYNG